MLSYHARSFMEFYKKLVSYRTLGRTYPDETSAVNENQRISSQDSNAAALVGNRLSVLPPSLGCPL